MAKSNPIKSRRKPQPQLDTKSWLEPERQSLEDVASQWGRSLSFVEECVRTLKFRHVIFVNDSTRGLPVTDHFFFHKDCWPFGDTTMNRVGTRPPIFAHLCDPSAYPNGYYWPSGAKVFIPVEEIKRIKKEKERKKSGQQIFLEADYHSKQLEAANYCSHRLYGLGEFVANRGHRDQILKLLEEKYGGQEWLSSKMKERIVQMVNKNPLGGSPRLNH